MDDKIRKVCEELGFKVGAFWAEKEIDGAILICDWMSETRMFNPEVECDMIVWILKFPLPKIRNCGILKTVMEKEAYRDKSEAIIKQVAQITIEHLIEQRKIMEDGKLR